MVLFAVLFSFINIMTINERFTEILKSKNISVKEAAVLFSKSEVYIRKLMRAGESFGIEPVLLILNSMGDISAEWLLTGRGEMLKTSTPATKEQPSEDANRLLPLVESQQRTIENLSRTIERLTK